MISRTWLMNPQKRDLVPSNASRRLTLGSRKCDEARLDVGRRSGSRLGCCGRLGFGVVRIGRQRLEVLVKNFEEFHFQARVVVRLALFGLTH